MPYTPLEQRKEGTMPYTPLEQYVPENWRDITLRRLGPNLQFSNRESMDNDLLRLLLSEKKLAPEDLELILKTISWKDGHKPG